MDVAEAAQSVRIAHPNRFYIGGEWVEPSTEGKIEVVSPATGEVVFTVAEGREADMDRAVEAAREAFDHGPWPRMTPEERAGYLRKFAEGLRARNEHLTHAYICQIGVIQSDAKAMSPTGAMTFDRVAALASSFQFEEEHIPSDGQGRGLIVREPVGVVAAIVPWNGPLMIACDKVAPALLAGCTVVLKPAPQTPIEAQIMAEVADAIGLPPGVLNVVPADRDASEHLIHNPGVDKVSFTGSTAAGKHIASVLGGRMARYTMELGGKSAAIVLDDIGTDEVVQSLGGAISLMSGQVCAALTRVIVPRARHDDFVDGFSSFMKHLTPGDPYDDKSMLGPLAMKRQLERVEDYIEKGKAEGAKLAVGGRRPVGLDRGYYIEPTLFAGVDNSMIIAREEIFGPVICLIPADSDDDALRIANDSVYGLNGAVMTHDKARAYEIGRKFRSGTFSQNRFRIDLGIGFGGFKESGVGREGGTEGLLSFLETKTMLLD